jgi:hypothetical protein
MPSPGQSPCSGVSWSPGTSCRFVRWRDESLAGVIPPSSTAVTPLHRGAAGDWARTPEAPAGKFVAPGTPAGIRDPLLNVSAHGWTIVVPSRETQNVTKRREAPGETGLQNRKNRRRTHFLDQFARKVALAVKHGPQLPSQ